MPWIVHLHPLPQGQVSHSCRGLGEREVGSSVVDHIHPDLEEARHILEDLVVAAAHIGVGSAEEDSPPGLWRCLWVEGAWASLIDVELQEHPTEERR